MAKFKFFERGKRYELKKPIIFGEAPKEGEKDMRREYNFVEPEISAVGKEKGRCWPLTSEKATAVTDNECSGTYGRQLKPLPIVSLSDCLT